MRVDAAVAVEPAVGRSGQGVRAVVHVEQHGVELGGAPAQRRGHIDFFHAHAPVLERVTGKRAERAAIPGHHRRNELRDDDRRAWRQNVERGAQREAHAEAANQDARRWRAEPAAGERRQRVLRAVLIARPSAACRRREGGTRCRGSAASARCRQAPPLRRCESRVSRGFFRAARYVRSRSGTQVCTARLMSVGFSCSRTARSTRRASSASDANRSAATCLGVSRVSISCCCVAEQRRRAHAHFQPDDAVLEPRNVEAADGEERRDRADDGKKTDGGGPAAADFEPAQAEGDERDDEEDVADDGCRGPVCVICVPIES